MWEAIGSIVIGIVLVALAYRWGYHSGFMDAHYRHWKVTGDNLSRPNQVSFTPPFQEPGKEGMANGHEEGAVLPLPSPKKRTMWSPPRRDS